jgi:hypothetical protein
MSKSKVKFLLFLIVIPVFALSFLALFIYPGFLNNSCESVSHTNGMVSPNSEGFCVFGATICEGFSCMAPLITAECGESQEVCGETLTCLCD